MAQAPKVDLSEFFKLSRPRKPPCKVGYARSSLSAEDAAKLDAAVATDPGIITNAAITEWLAARKHDVTISGVTIHRKTVTGAASAGKCSCGDS